MKRLLSVAILASVVMFAGCPKIEQDGYNTVVAAKAFLDTTKAQHPECANGNTATLCVDLVKATSAKDALIDALEVFCASPEFNAGGVCTAPVKGTPAYQQAISKLQAAIASYNQTAADLQGVLR